jgi:5'/3'-nucleotidase SurE
MENLDPLHILLTNDDGHQAPGIQVLHRVLKAAGHRVSMVAPSNQQSAASMGVTSRRNLQLQKLEDSYWHLDGQPVDTVLVALRHLLRDDPPDLVLSGINFGPNVGTALYMSGTFGAALMASINGIPAIAVSAGMRWDEISNKFPSTHEVLEPAAAFTSSVVDSLRNSAGHDGRLLPKEILLNINYPALPRHRIKGVLHPEISTGQLVELGYQRCDETGHVIPRYYAGAVAEESHKEDGDVRAHLEGYITVSAVKPNWKPPASEADELRRRLGNLGRDF